MKLTKNKKINKKNKNTNKQTKQKQTNKQKQKKKSRKIVFPKLVTSVYFQKGLNPQIVENKETQRNLCKNKEWS